jgi:hypothetical protein
MAIIAEKLKDRRGQMTVELCVMLPVAMLIALIAINAMDFLVTCASFDRQAKSIVRLVASSPANSVNDVSLAATVETRLQEKFTASNIAIEVHVQGSGTEYRTFTAKINYSPTLFGMDFREKFFGVKLGTLTHETQLTLEVYRVGSSIINVL